MPHTQRILIALLLVFSSCSTFQSGFTPGRLMVGKTDRAQVIEYFGRPDGIDTITGPGITKVTSLFDYGFTRAEPPEVFHGVWQVPQRNLVLELVDDTLQGYLGNNSTDHGSTAFSKRLRWRIPIGRATKEDVLLLLGEPSGKFLLPTNLFDHPGLGHLRHDMPSNSAEAWCYYYDYLYFRAGTRGPLAYYRFLAVYFNSTGTVIDKFYGESDKAEPQITRIFAP